MFDVECPLANVSPVNYPKRRGLVRCRSLTSFLCSRLHLLLTFLARSCEYLNMEATESPNSGSPLSEISSDDERIYLNPHQRESTLSDMDSDADSTPLNMPPNKRRRTGGSAFDHGTPLSAATYPDESLHRPPSPSGSISSDTSGSVPTSPSFAQLGPTHPLSSAYAAAQLNPDDPEAGDPATTQITRCMWTDCPEPEQGNMDNLVNHIHEYHIGMRQKKYSCEWEGCGRKGMPHASGYALRAHMRSHTKEKPFFCALPECDRSFTRSDALAKHMRTVHETEALRPSDPVPRGHTGGISNGGTGNLRRIKLIVNGSNGSEKRPSIIGELPPLPSNGVMGETGEVDGPDIDSSPFELPVRDDYYPSDVSADMDAYEKSLPPSQYFRVLRRQTQWAEQESKELEKELQEVRSLVEAADGKLVKKGDGGFASSDENRHLSWRLTESLLDEVLRADMEKLWEAVPDKNEEAKNDGWQMLRAVEDVVAAK